MNRVALPVGDWACRIYNMDQCINAHTRATLGLGVLIAGALFAIVGGLLVLAFRG